MSISSPHVWARSLVLALLCWVSTAFGAPSPLHVELDYRVDPTLPSCPTRNEFEALVRREVGYDAFQPGAVHRVEARVAPAPNGIRGFVEWRDSNGLLHGERELYVETADCSAFARVMGFAIAVQLELFNRQAAFPSEAAPEAAASAPATAPPPARDAPGNDAADGGPPSDGATTWQLLVGAGPALALGLTSQAVLQGRVFVLARSGWFGAELAAEATLESRHETAPGQRVDQQATLGSLGLCAFEGALSACLLGKAGALRVEGVGVDVERAPWGAVAQVGPRVSVWTELGDRWRLGLRAEGLVQLVPWTVTLDQREVWTVPTWGGGVGVDLALVVHDNP